MRKGFGIMLLAILFCLPMQIVTNERLQAQSEQEHKSEADRLLEMGEQQFGKSQYQEAFKTFQSALESYRLNNNRKGEADAIISLAHIFNSVGTYQKALELYQQALGIKKQIGDREGEGNALHGLGDVYDSLGQYSKAIEFHQQALDIAKQIGDRDGEGNALNGLADVYESLGQYPKAITLYQQSLVLRKQIGDRIGEAYVLFGLADIYETLEDYPKSLDFYQQSLAIRQQIGDRNGEASSLFGLGIINTSIGQHQKAIDYFQQSLAIKKQIGDRNGEAYILNGLGYVYGKVGQYDQTIDFLQQSLSISKQIGDRYSEGYSLENLGLALSKLNQTELAILFYKQSVNVHESIRKDIRKLPKEIQKTYLSTIEESYRNLADLLLKQNRILEAQQVLDLLKVQELSAYLRNVRGNSETEKGLNLYQSEQNIIALAIELNSLLQKERNNQLSASEQQRLNKLIGDEKDRNKQFSAFLNNPEVQKSINELRNTEKNNIDLENVRNLRNEILSQRSNVAILYPLVLEDRLELILLTAQTPPIRRTIAIRRDILNKEIAEFVTNLRDTTSEDVKVSAQKFHTWLIEPFETELAQLKIDTIAYAPDSRLRYIPLAALYDGKQWLAEKYRINYITAQSLTKFNVKQISTPHILAGAFGGKSNENRSGFNGLPATVIEVKKIANRFGNTTTLVESDFSKTITESKANSYTILHLATHGQLVQGKPEDSFILFGNGDKATVSEIRDWALNNVDLVVLSACQSGVGGKLGNGIEILGLGYQMQVAGARVAIASLWQVDDTGTQVLMEAFYSELQKGNVTISESLRRAQVSLIKSPNYSHPYFWSAFFAIGNAL
ncbi:CHAT domain-containing protein [Pseudanabaena yagii]|uniref:Tetratricopeptide repeat protein n=1 Tax=Pseudanabaena yagii GIHE-NHR1 TaxID=2722753 RepID=A0ABX1LN49_9CYAN|nr:CHAT domain-containing protein [Pseudanabaena yagii]NMF56580.1 tetratricopeptide repeat protein [Pseudanabaena yagii GIHE-NHR1]